MLFYFVARYIEIITIDYAQLSAPFSEYKRVKAVTRRPRRPAGHWVYYSLEEGLLWPCPVHWEWENSYGGWLPFYCSPTLEYIAADPNKVVKRSLRAASTTATVARLREYKLQEREE